MTVELNTLSPKKWVANYSGARPTIDTTDGVLVGDFAIDNSTTPYTVWKNEDNTNGSPVWTIVKNGPTSVVSKTTTYTITNLDRVVLCDATSGVFTVTLPQASLNEGLEIIIKKTDSSANDVTVNGNSDELIDGELTRPLTTQYECIEIICDGTGWIIK